MEKIAHAIVNPLNSLNLLSKADIEGLTSSGGDLFALFRHCALAILNTDSDKGDPAKICCRLLRLRYPRDTPAAWSQT